MCVRVCAGSWRREGEMVVFPLFVFCFCFTSYVLRRCASGAFVCGCVEKGGGGKGQGTQTVLPDTQHSSLPLSPRYLESLLSTHEHRAHRRATHGQLHTLTPTRTRSGAVTGHIADSVFVCWFPPSSLPLVKAALHASPSPSEASLTSSPRLLVRSCRIANSNGASTPLPAPPFLPITRPSSLPLPLPLHMSVCMCARACPHFLLASPPLLLPTTAQLVRACCAASHVTVGGKAARGGTRRG